MKTLNADGATQTMNLGTVQLSTRDLRNAKNWNTLQNAANQYE